MSENIGRYNVILNYEVEKEKLKQGSDSVKKEVSGMQASFLKARNAFAGIVAIGGLQQIGSAIFEVTKKYQQYETILRVALGSQKESQKSMKLIQDTAKSTIFSVDELTASYIKFVNRGIKPTQGEIVKIADLAASQGKSFEQLTEAILDTQTGEFERLKEFGIKASSEGNKVSLSFRGMNQTIEKTPEAINAAIVSMGALNGIAGSNKEQMSTLSGVISNLGDTFDQLFKAIGDRFSVAIGAVLSGFSSLVSIVNDFMSIPLEKKLIDEQNELNLLVAQITEANITQDERNKLIGKLQAEYPDFLQNLDAEKVSNGQLALRLQEANNQYILRIALAKQQQKLDEAAEKLADAQLRQVDKNRQNLKILTDLDRKYKLGVDFTNKSLAERQRLVTDALFAAQRRGVNIGLDNARAAGIDVFGNVESSASKLQSVFDNVKNDTEEIKKELQSILKVGDFTGFVESEAKTIEKTRKLSSDKAKTTAAKIKTELEKLNEEQKTLQDKLQNDLLKGAPIDQKSVTRINEIKLKIEDLNLVIERLFNPDNEGVTSPVVQQLTKLEKIKLQGATTEIKAIVEALSQMNKAGIISDETFDNLNIFEKAFDFKGGLSPEKQKEVTDKMKAALNESIAKARGEFNTSDSESGEKVPFFQQLFGFDNAQFAQFTNALKSAEQATLETLKTIFEQEQQLNQQRIDAQDERVQAALAMAEKGKVEQLKIEEERLSELKKKQQSFANAQRAIASFQIATSSAVAVAEGIKAVSSAFASGGPAAIPLGIATSLALVAQVAGIVASIRGAFSGLQLRDGIEQVKGPGTRRSDSISAMLSRDERVVDAETNSKIGFGFKNKDLPKAVDFYKQHKDSALLFANKPFYPQFQRVAFGQHKSNDKAISRRLENIENTLKGMSVNVNLDSEGLAVEIMKKFENYETRKRYVA